MAPTQIKQETGFDPSFEVLYPPVISVTERPEDAWSRLRAEHIIERAGNVAAQNLVEVALVSEEQSMTLHQAIQEAAQGNEQARQMVAANVRTEAVEITFKAGFVTETKLSVNAQGQLLQFGQTAEDVTYNSLRFASESEVIRPRSEAEARNSMRIEDLYQQGLLSDYYFVVFSRCADGSDEDLKEGGFFTETKSMAIQATTIGDDEEVILESAFVAGVIEDDAPRHDQQVLKLLAPHYGVDFDGLNDAEIIDTPLLVHKSQMPNGVVDIVSVVDQFTEEVTGRPAFYGQAKPPQDYLAHRKRCQLQQDELEDRVHVATNQLINEASSIQDPVLATQRLHKIVEAQMVQEAATNKEIDTRVFGHAAAFHIEAARAHIQVGDIIAANGSLRAATLVARSLSCPSALLNSGEVGGSTMNTDQGTESTSEDCKEVKNGDRVNCPFCKQKVTAIVPNKEEIYCSNGDCKAAHHSVKGKK